MNAFSALYTPARCVITHDDRDRPVFRLRLQVHVADVADAGTDDALEVRLQSPAWLVPAVTNWRPAGNSTWVDSTPNDFERNSNLTYALMVTTVSQASDLTQITLAKPVNDTLCVADLSLLVNPTLAYTHTYDNTLPSIARPNGRATV